MDQLRRPDHHLQTMPSSLDTKRGGVLLTFVVHIVLLAMLGYIETDIPQPPAERVVEVRLLPLPAVIGTAGQKAQDGVPAVGAKSGAGFRNQASGRSVMQRAPVVEPDKTNEKNEYVLLLWRHLQRYVRNTAYEGVVVVDFDIDKEGRLNLVQINRSSGNRVLDDAALALLRRAEPLPPIPASLNVDHFLVEVPISWQLDAAQAQANQTFIR